MKNLDIYIVDAFTNENFKGNSAAVIPLESWLPDEIMQSIAFENNLSETAFLKQIGNNHYHIRWFSPISEIDFCGHASLASAFVLFEADEKQNNIKFYAEAVGDFELDRKTNGFIEMTFPNRSPEKVHRPPQALLDGLSLQPIEILKNEQAYFAVFSSQKEIETLTYHSEILKQLAPFDVVVTAKSERGFKGKPVDFVSRYFWPANGGDEDPVTGSIHTGLAPYWAEQLGKNKLVAFQASQRGGLLYCELKGDKVHISGQAVMYLKGTISI